MTTDYRALCSQLADELHKHTSLYDGHESELVARARAALAQPEPEGPTDEEINDLYWATATAHPVRENIAVHIAGLRAVLQRWTHPTLTPIPVSERLPEDGDCIGNPRNGEGLWCWGREVPRTTAGTPVIWRLMPRECLEVEAMDWLPAHALPLPTTHRSTTE